MEEDNDLLSNPNLYGHGCVLSAHGRGFEPKLFLDQTILPPDVFAGFGKLGFPEQFKEQVIEKEGPDGAALFEAKILALKLSNSGVNRVQHKDAIAFLSRYRDEILRLAQFPHVEQVNLRCIAAHGESFEERHPDELVALAAACGLTSLM
jgi:hypothetical protein